MLSKGSLLWLTCLLFTLTIAVAQSEAEWAVVQPAESQDGLVLWSRPGAARVVVGDRASSVSLRSGEELTDIAELEDGWVAAGRRTVGGKTRLVVLTDDSQGLRRLESPAPATGELQLRPRLLVDDGRLAGVAWLEGATPRELTVRARRWSGVDWGPTELVGPRVAGSQTGLASVTLGDGNELLMWSAFDGNDDEIVFSRSRGDGWTTPRRVAAGNRVPDVAPAVIATRAGALAAWSRAGDDGYELVVARYRRGVWQKPRVAARDGALFARFVRRDGRLLLLYRRATPRGWGVAELGPNGLVRRRATFLKTAPDRPALELDGVMGVNLRMPDRTVARGYWDTP